MGVLRLHCLSVLLLLFINTGSSYQAMKQTKKYDNVEDQNNLLSSSEATRMLMHDTYPTTTIIHDTYPTDVPMGPTDIPTYNPTPTTTPTTAPPTIPTTTPTPSGGGGGFGGGGVGGGGGDGGGGWCVANPSASEKALQVALDYACGYGGADCSTIQPEGSCYNPDTVHDHASYAFNDYYQKNPAPTSCVFGGTAQLVNNDPSSGSCHYQSSGGSASTPPATPTLTMPSPPDMMMSPPSPMFSGNPIGGGTGPGGTGFVPEPIGSPNMAASTSSQLLMFLFSSTGILMYILVLGHHL